MQNNRVWHRIETINVNTFKTDFHCVAPNLDNYKDCCSSSTLQTEVWHALLYK